jgi:lipopolysaccharide transport system ATP-binding protein
MSDDVISVENISKRYVIGHQRNSRDGLRHAVEDALRNPFRWLSRIREDRKNAEEEFWALKDVSFNIKRGDVVGIIGRNGAGKSTLLKILSRITEPTTGRIRIKGRVASLLEVGTGFHQELTGRENIFLNGAILGMSRMEIKRKFEEIVAFSEIEKFLDTPVKRYSSGMYVRLAFAVAAHLDPEILIVDEVLAVGDTEFQKKCLGKMQSVAAQQQRTILFVSHNLSAIEQLCSRAILLRSGRVYMDSEVEKVTSAYLGDASVSTSGEFDLSTHPSRAPNDRPLITGMTLLGDDDLPTSRLFPDEQAKVVITLRLDYPIRDPRMALSIEDSIGRRIMTMASYFGDTKLPTLADRCVVTCFLGALQLGAGTYFLSVSIAEKAEGLLDSLNSAARFDVEWRNNYGNGEPYHPVYGPVLRTSTWSRGVPVRTDLVEIRATT